VAAVPTDSKTAMVKTTGKRRMGSVSFYTDTLQRTSIRIRLVFWVYNRFTANGCLYKTKSHGSSVQC
jgi:hypothetical protein